MECPVISTSVGGPAEIIENDVSGFVLPPADLEGWTEQALGLIDDEQLRGRIGAAARARVEAEFTDSHHAAAVLSLYRSLVPDLAIES
jgi:glycosyltransferase involved in cell wall biosynthesis